MISKFPRKLKYSSNVNVICHGNSITYGALLSDPATQAWPSIIGGLWPLAGHSVSVVNLGHPGWTWEMLGGKNSGYYTDVVSSVSSTNRNILVVSENVNSLEGGDSADQVKTAISYYCNTVVPAARAALTTGSLSFVLMTAIPFNATSGLFSDNESVNAWMLQNYRALGAEMVIDSHPPRTPFHLDAFNPTSALWGTLYIDSGTHPNAAGHAVMASIVAPQLSRLNA